MAYCEMCDKDFKSEQGLAGHRALKHAGQHSAERQGEGSLGAQSSAGDRLARAEDDAGEPSC